MPTSNTLQAVPTSLVHCFTRHVRGTSSLLPKSQYKMVRYLLSTHRTPFLFFCVGFSYQPSNVSTVIWKLHVERGEAGPLKRRGTDVSSFRCGRDLGTTWGRLRENKEGWAQAGITKANNGQGGVWKWKGTTLDAMRKLWTTGCGGSRRVSKNAVVLRTGDLSSSEKSKHSETWGAGKRTSNLFQWWSDTAFLRKSAVSKRAPVRGGGWRWKKGPSHPSSRCPWRNLLCL